MPYEDDDELILTDPGAAQRARASELRRDQRRLALTPTSGVETPPPRPGTSPLAPATMRSGDYRGRAFSLLEQASQAGAPAEVDVEALRKFAAERDEAAQRDFRAGVALTALGGESFKPIGEHVLRRSLAAQGPMEFGGGMIARGQFVTDPRAASASRTQRLEAQARIYESMAQHAESVEQRDAAQKAANDLKLQIAQMKQQDGPKLHLQRAGTTPGGDLVTFDPNTGQQSVNGRPYTGPVMSQTALDKQAGAVQEALSSGARLKNLDQMVAQNPNAFGGVATLSQLTPQIIAGRWRSARLTPEEQQTRALVMQEAAQVINDLYGAAVSAGEMGRANTFVPTGLDNPATVAVKLKAAQAWAASKSRQYGEQVRGAAESRMGGGAARGGPPPGAVQRLD